MRPSKIRTIKTKYAWWLPSHFSATMLFGTLYYGDKNEVIDDVTLNHEQIHVNQAFTTKDSWWRYYLTYIWLWIRNIPLMSINFYAPYKFDEFELEAFLHEEDLEYKWHTAIQWKTFKRKLKLKDKRQLAKLWYGHSPESIEIKMKGFANFIKDYIL